MINGISSYLDHSFPSPYIEKATDFFKEKWLSLVLPPIELEGRRIAHKKIKDIFLEMKGETFNAANTLIKVDLVASFSTHSPFTKTKMLLLNFFGECLHFIPNLLNILLTALRLFDTGKNPQSFWEVSAAIEILYKFIAIPAAVVVVVHLLFPALGLSTYLIAGGIVLALAAALFVYARWIKPCPIKFDRCENLTWEAMKGALSPITGREEELDALIAPFTAGLERNPLLVGESGVGKNEIVLALAQKIAKGEVPDRLKGKHVIQISAAVLNDFGGFSDPLKSLEERVGRGKENYIFFFNELHAACSKKGTLDFLKDFFDKFDCIGATTPEGYEEIKKDIAFAGRLNVINVEPMQKEAIKELLKGVTKTLSPPLRIKESVYDEIINTRRKEGERAEPAASKARFLERAGRLIYALEKKPNGPKYKKALYCYQEVINYQTMIVKKAQKKRDDVEPLRQFFILNEYLMPELEKELMALEQEF